MTLAKQYRKRPTVVEAVQLTQSNVEEVRKWLTTAHQRRPEGLVILTLEGEMLAHWGDYIVKGAIGEFYPVRMNVFEITYDTHLGYDPDKEE